MQAPQHATVFNAERLLDAIASSGNRPVIIDFWTPRCSACRSVLHTIDDIACRVGDRAVVGTLNVRDHTAVAQTLGVEVVPTLLVFRNGEEAARLPSAKKIQSFDERLEDELFGGSLRCA